MAPELHRPAETNRPRRVSVIIPYFHAHDTLRPAMESLLHSGYPDLEIICVDDRSEDDTWETVADFPVIHIAMIRRSGAAVARNTGASRASGEILFFVDADVAVLPDAISKMAETFTGDPDVDACFGEYTALPVERNFASTYKNLVHHFTHQISRPEAHTFWCGCGAIRAEVFRAVGGFDESYTASSVEDIELGYRLTEAGHRVLLNKEIRVQHAKRYTLSSLIKSDFRDRAIPWTLLMARKNVFYADLNLRTVNIVSALVLVLLLPLSIAALFVLSPENAYFAPLAACLIYLVLNGRIFRFVLRQKGILFLVGFVFMYTFTYLYSVLGFVIGIFLFVLEKIRYRKATASKSS